MACCLMAPGHYQNQWWLGIINMVWRIHLKTIPLEMFKTSIAKLCLKTKTLKWQPQFNGDNELRNQTSVKHCKCRYPSLNCVWKWNIKNWWPRLKGDSEFRNQTSMKHCKCRQALFFMHVYIMVRLSIIKMMSWYRNTPCLFYTISLYHSQYIINVSHWARWTLVHRLRKYFSHCSPNLKLIV